MKRNKSKQDDNFMLYVPQKRHMMFEEKNGRVKLIFQHDRIIEKFARWLVKKSRFSDVELDEIGSATWKLIDGSKSVYNINKRLYEIFGERCNPGNMSLVMYLRYMNRKGWISFQKGKQ